MKCQLFVEAPIFISRNRSLWDHTESGSFFSLWINRIRPRFSHSANTITSDNNIVIIILLVNLHFSNRSKEMQNKPTIIFHWGHCPLWPVYPPQLWFSWKYKLMGYYTSFSSSLCKFKPCSSFALSSIIKNSVNNVRIKHCLLPILGIECWAILGNKVNVRFRDMVQFSKLLWD